jgi:hypothetical protein
VNNQSLFGARLDDAQKWLSLPNENIHLLICHGFKPKELTSINSPTYGVNKQSKQNDAISPSVPIRPILTQQIISPVSSTKSNGILNSSSPNNISISPKSQQPPPPVPAKPKLRPSNTQFVPINGDNLTATTATYQTSSPRTQPQNGFEVDESDISVTESEKSFKDKKKFFESGFKDSGPKPKPRQFKYINEHELLRMKQEEDQKVKTMSPTELLQSRTTYDNDPESMQTTLSQYQTPTYLAKPEEDDDDIVQPQTSRTISSAARVRYDLMGINETKSDLV